MKSDQDFQAKKNQNVNSDSYGVRGFILKTIGVALTGAFLPALAFGMIL